MIPKCGPALFSPREFAWAVVPGGGDLGPITFRFPRNLFVTGLMVLTGDGSVVDLAHLFIRIQDETFQDVITDGQGTTLEAGLLALRGIQGKPFPLQRPLMSGDLWLITLSNLSPNDIRISGLFLFFDEPVGEVHA
jgi:hypothetical protein